MSKISNSIFYTLLATGLTNCAHNGVTSHVKGNNQNEIAPPCNAVDPQHQASSSQIVTHITPVFTKEKLDYIKSKLEKPIYERLLKSLKIDENLIGKDINAKIIRGETLLHVLTNLIRKEDAIKEILSWGVDLHARDCAGYTPLHSAVSCGNKHFVEALIANKVDLNPINNKNETPLDLAFNRAPLASIYKEIQDIIQLLQNAGVKQENSLLTQEKLDDLKSQIPPETIQRIIQDGHVMDQDINRKDKHGQTLLHQLPYYIRYKESIDIILSSEFQIDAQEEQSLNTPLHNAVYCNNQSFTEALIAQKADVNAKNKMNETPLDIALSLKIKGENVDQIIQLLQNASAKAKQENSIWTQKKIDYIRSKVDPETMAFLHLNDSLTNQDLNVKDVNGRTFLHKVSFFIQQKEVIDTILSWNFQIDVKDDQRGETPLHWSICYNNIYFSQALIEKKADINALNINKKTPLDMAFFYRDKSNLSVDESIQLLHSVKAKRLYPLERLWDPVTTHPDPISNQALTSTNKLFTKEMVCYILSNLPYTAYDKLGNIELFIGKDINFRDADGENLLHKLVHLVNIPEDVVNNISSWGIDVHAKDNFGKTPFDYNPFSAILYSRIPAPVIHPQRIPPAIAG